LRWEPYNYNHRSNEINYLCIDSSFVPLSQAFYGNGTCFFMQECRKDIIFENDFINQKTKSKSTSFYSKYADKLKQNKMRLTYLVGFSVVFSLNFLYDCTHIGIQLFSNQNYITNSIHKYSMLLICQLCRKYKKIKSTTERKNRFSWVTIFFNSKENIPKKI